MKYILIIVVILAVGCVGEKNLFTGQLIAQPTCQDVQVPYIERVPVEVEKVVEGQEVHSEPEIYEEKECIDKLFRFVIVNERREAWSAQNPLCRRKVELGNIEQETGIFRLTDKVLINAKESIQIRLVEIPPVSTVLVEFLHQCEKSDRVSFQSIEVEAPTLTICDNVEKVRGNPIIRSVETTETVTEYREVTKYRIERQCE